MDETKFLEYYNDLTRQIADPIIDNVNYINLRVTGNGLHAFVNYCLEKEREANKANSENANCAIFDVSKMLPDLEHCKNTKLYARANKKLGRLL